MTLIGGLAKQKTGNGVPFQARVSIVMLVHEPQSTRHFGPLSADLTQRLEQWLRQKMIVEKLSYQDTLENILWARGTILVVPNYDWLVRMPRRGRLRRVFREAFLARKLNASVLAAPVDLWSLRLNLQASILIGLAGGWTLICQNSVQQAKEFLLPNPVAAPWNWPRAEARKWTPVTSWESRQSLALLAASGDPIRQTYFEPLRVDLVSSGFEVRETQKNLPWEEYVSLVQSARIVVTTCWIQPIFQVGPDRFRNLIADGHVTMRVWEGFAVGATVMTPEVVALKELGFLPGVHFVALPSDADWESWKVPPEDALASIARAGHHRFLELVD